MQERKAILREIADLLLAMSADRVVRAAIDGVDGAGKTWFADELADVIEASGRRTIRASVDSFHNPRAIRYRLGKRSPEGFFLDSYDYTALKRVLLDPLSPGGNGEYRRRFYDHRLDSPVTAPDEESAPGDILILDGIFLHRPELRSYWDFSIFLEVGFDISIPRGAQRGEGSPDPGAPENHRYVEGQKIYLRTCDPRSHATLVINNEDLASPYIVS